MTRVQRAIGVLACVAALAALAAVAAAQPAGKAVRGTVVDEAGLPVAGATVLLGEQATVTDRDGAFVVSGGGAGGGKLTVIANGYQSQTIGLADGVVVRLARADEEVITVTGRAPEEDKPLEYTMSAADVRTTPGAMNDALRAVTVLPAAARIPFSFGGLVLRGMSPRDSSVFIDGVEIPLAFHFGGITGVFPTQVLGDMKVVPSGFDVSIGRTQGGAIELASRTPRGDAYRVGGETSLLHSMATAEGPLPGRGAFLLALRRSYFDVLVRPFIGRNDPLPSYADGQLRAVWGEAAKRGQLAVYVLGSLDRLANSDEAAVPNDPDAEGHVAADLGFLRAGASYKRRIDTTLVTIAPSVGTNVLGLSSKDFHGTDRADVLDLHRRWYVFGARGEWLRDDPGGFLRAGLDLDGGYLGRVSATTVFQDDLDDFPVPRNTVLWANAAIFAEARRHWYGDRLSVRPGLRLERFGLGNEWAIDPRVNAHVALSDISRLRASLGRFHQPPSPAHFDEFTDNLGAKSSYVDQGTLGVEWTPEAALAASVTGFVHRGRRTLVDVMENPRDDLIDVALIFRELLEEQLGFYGYQANVGRQLSYGVEVALRYDLPAFRVMANYAWSRAKRRYDPALGGGWEPYGLDQPMRLNLLFATTAFRWNVGSRLTAVSGNPVHVVPEGTMATDDPEPPKVLLRLPTFWQVDLRIDRLWKRPWGSISLFFDIQNITNHRNVEFRDSNPYLSDPRNPTSPAVYRYDDTRGLPILPYIGVELVPR